MAETTTKKTTTKKTTAKAAKPLQFLGTGKRKDAVARVRVLLGGNGIFQINGKDINDYFVLGTLKLIAKQALELTKTTDKYDVHVNVNGGGLTGQAGAIRHGIARALVKADETLKAELKAAGFLTRDARIKERRKYGLKKARKGSQFSKR